MKALTVQQPMALAIAMGVKLIENRSWAPSLKAGARFAIHAGKARMREQDEEWVEEQLGLGADDVEYGAIIATVQFDRLIHTSKEAGQMGQTRFWGGPLAWVLSGAILLPKPIPCTGQLGLWNVPAEIEAKLKRKAA